MTTCPDCGKPLYEDSIHTCTPLALKLTQDSTRIIERLRRTPMPLKDVIPHMQAMGDELRRLHEQKEHWIEQWEEVCNENQILINENEALREALQEIVDAADGSGWNQLDAGFTKARAALARTGEKT